MDLRAEPRLSSNPPRGSSSYDFGLSAMRKKCVICGNSFWPRALQKTCSPECACEQIRRRARANHNYETREQKRERSRHWRRANKQRINERRRQLRAEKRARDPETVRKKEHERYLRRLAKTNPETTRRMWRKKYIPAAKATHLCVICRSLFQSNQWGIKTCSTECRREWNRERRLIPEWQRVQPSLRSCGICAEQFFSRRHRKLYCSAECVRESKRRRDAKKRRTEYQKEYQRQYHIANSERVREYQRQYRNRMRRNLSAADRTLESERRSQRRDAAPPKLVHKECTICGQSFGSIKGKNGNVRKTCSAECARTRLATCRACAEQFLSRSHACTCSPECRRQYRRRYRKSEKYREANRRYRARLKTRLLSLANPTGGLQWLRKNRTELQMIKRFLKEPQKAWPSLNAESALDTSSPL